MDNEDNELLHNMHYNYTQSIITAGKSIKSKPTINCNVCGLKVVKRRNSLRCPECAYLVMQSHGSGTVKAIIDIRRKSKQ